MRKKSHFFLIILLTLTFTIGAIGLGVAASRVGGGLQSSLIKTIKTKKKTSKLFKKTKQRLVAEAETAAGEPVRASAEESTPKVSCVFLPNPKITYEGEFMNAEMEVSAASGEEFTVSFFIKNTGTAPWFGDFSGCSYVPYVRLGTARERDRSSVFFNPADVRWLGPNRIAMTEGRVDPGETATFKFTSKTPMATDIFKEYFQPVVEGVQWMDSKKETAALAIYAGEYDPDIKSKVKYLGNSGQLSALDLNAEVSIEINLTTQTMFIKLGNTAIREFSISTGKYTTPTPAGRFKILLKQNLRIGNKYPHYHMPFFQAFTQWGHGLHALPYLANDRGVFWNEALNHLGQRVSHGCVRMADEEAEDLYNLTVVGTPVVIHY